MSSPNTPQPTRPSQTKIVATMGPACDGADRLAELIEAGVDVFRINMAHGDRRTHGQRLAAVREASRRTGRPVGVLVDLAGPKIRLGELPDDQLSLDAGDQVRFVRGNFPAPGELTTTYESLVDELDPGDRVMLADGTVSLVVEAKGDDFAECRVVQPGVIRSRQGVNLPGVKLSVSALGPADRENAVWAAENEIDFVGLSFVRKADDVRQLKDLLASNGSQAHVVAKIEKPEAVEAIEAIVEAADALMVARGDLGVEIDIAEVPVVQKRIIEAANRLNRPVIIATQMLDSMQHSRLPTRAEVTDVANAILDGADACMLSGETAIGKYPLEAVEMMHRVALATEPIYRENPPEVTPDFATSGVNEITEVSVHAAALMAEELDAKMIVVASASGATALALSKNRAFVPTVGVSHSEAALRRMCLYWGVIPMAGAPVHDSRRMLEYVVDRARTAGHVAPGDRVLLVAGTGLRTTAHNMIVVHEVE